MSQRRSETDSPREIVLYEGQRRALLQMMSGIDDAARWIVLVGPAGIGKSIILKVLIGELQGTDADVVVCDGFESVEPDDLMMVVQRELPLPTSPSRAGRDHAEAIVASRQTHTNPLVVIVDNAHAVSRETFKVLAEVASHTSAEHGGAWIVLAGRPALEAAALRAGGKLPSVRCTPAPLSAPEIARHVDRCLQSGLQRSVSVSPGALEKIGRHTGGIPARIAALCHLIARRPSVRLAGDVTADVVEEAADRLGVDPSSAPPEQGRRLRSDDEVPRSARRWPRRLAMVAVIIAVGALGWAYGPSLARTGRDWVAQLFPAELVGPAKPSDKAARPGTSRREAGGAVTASARSTAGRPAGEQRSGSRRPDDETRPDRARSGPRPVSTEQVAALIDAARGGHSDDLARALSAGVPAEVRDAGGVTALMHAVIQGQVDAGRMLLDKGAQVNARDRGGITPVMLAVINDRPDALRLLLDRGADVNARSGSGWTALTFAAWKGDPDMVRALMKHGAKRNVVDKQGWTPLDYAAANMESVPTDSDQTGAPEGPPRQGSRHSEVVSLLRGAHAP